MRVITKKICMIGDFGVGKTSLIRQFVERQFSDKYLSTVGVKISRKTVVIHQENSPEEQSIQLLIWDIEGQTKFKPIAKTYLQGASGALIVADVSRPETIESLKEHIQLFLSANLKGWIAIALNKIDLVTPETLEGFFGHLRFEEPSVFKILPTSAKEGKNVDEIFEGLAKNILNE